MSHEREIEGYVLDGMARALWIHAYMMWALEVEPPPKITSDDWESQAPNTAATRKASMQAATALATLVQEANHLGTHPLAELFLKVSAIDNADYAYVFGEELAALSVGTLDADDSRFVLPPQRASGGHASTYWRPVVPNFKVELDDDGRELSWEGGIDEPAVRVNPPPKRRAAAPRRAPAPRRYDDDPSDADVDADIARLDEGLHRQQVASENIPLPPAMVPVLVAYRNQLDSMLSPEGAARKKVSIDRMLSRGLIDQDTLGYIDGTDVDDWVRNPAASASVLLLEDEPKIQVAMSRWVKKIFGAGNVGIVVADNVDAAIANLAVHDVKLIVSDVDVLGNKTGLDFFDYVKSNHPELVDRFIFFTGNSAARDVHYRYVPKGASSFEDFKRVWRADRQELLGDAAPPPRPGARTVAPTRTTTAPPSLQEIAQAVRTVMPTIHETQDDMGRARGRFGTDKVFIASVWDALQADPRLRGMTLDQFKHVLLAANREGLLDLRRADATAEMDPTALQRSEILDMGATFHFILDPALRSRSRSRPADAAADLSPNQFAGIVTAELPYVVAEAGSGGKPRSRFGRKVFISALWQQLKTHPRFEGMTLAEFKRRLIEAHRAQLLTLARADFVAAMDSRAVAESEAVTDGATFHFVVGEE